MSRNNSSLNLALTPGRRLLLLLCFFIACYVLLALLTAVALHVFGTDSTPAMRIITVVQDILLFIVPAVGTAVLVCRRPDILLAVDKAPRLLPTLAGVATLIVSIPLMNSIITFNEGISLPPRIAQTFHDMEEAAAGTIALITGPHTIPNLIMTILIVGVMAGLSEELLFRGCLQRLLFTGGLSAHAAVWIAAFIFSALHFQFYGFLPRMLLGAFFGYVLYWTGSLWVPVILHITNNTLYLIEEYRSYGVDAAPGAEDGGNLLMTAGSAILTAIGLYAIYRLSRQKHEAD